jgi:GNAT superfamily N-acetyltransferase
MHIHQFNDERTLSLLRSYLPYSLPLCRRIQSRHRSTHSQILASFLHNDDSLNIDAKNTCFVLAFVDRSVRPETEAWFFAPGEMPSHGQIGASCSCFKEILRLLNHVSNMPVPESGQAIANDTPLSSQHGSQTVLLCGAVSNIWARKLQETSLLSSEFPGLARPCALITLEKETVSKKCAQLTLPDNIRLGVISEPEHFELVRSRSDIPRQIATLKSIPSKAFFHTAGPQSDEQLVAWVFLGPDLSLSTLHVEPEWRRLGLGRMLASALLAESGGREILSYTCVFKSNAPSLFMFEKLGGSLLGECYWVRIDLNKVRENMTNSGLVA